MDDGIITPTTTTTSTTGDKRKLYWRNSNEYFTPATTTINVSNVCGGNSGSSTSSNFAMYLFSRHDYEKLYIVYGCFCLFIIITFKRKRYFWCCDIYTYIYTYMYI